MYHCCNRFTHTVNCCQLSAIIENMVSLETEIRKLRPVNLCRLAELLSPDLWKTVMGNIKKPGSQNIPMFTSEHIAMIETAATKQRKLASEIFLDEWGTMGRERPTIKATINLLVETELFRAADYLAVEVMKGIAPNRPMNGPAAAIEIPADIMGDDGQQYDTSNNDFVLHDHTTDTMNDHDVDCSVFSHHWNDGTGIIEGQFLEESLKNDHDHAANVPPDSSSDSASDLIEFSSNKSESAEKLESTSNAANDMKNVTMLPVCFLPNLSALNLNRKDDSTMQKDFSASNLQKFPQELMSSELPLCIKDRGVMSSYQKSSCEDDYSITCTNSSDLHTNTSDNSEDYYLSEMPIEHSRSHKQEIDVRVNDIVRTNTVDYNELPLTVVELCKS